MICGLTNPSWLSLTTTRQLPVAGPWADVQNIFGIIPDSENLGHKSSENDVAEVGDRDHISDKAIGSKSPAILIFYGRKLQGSYFKSHLYPFLLRVGRLLNSGIFLNTRTPLLNTVYIGVQMLFSTVFFFLVFCPENFNDLSGANINHKTQRSLVRTYSCTHIHWYWYSSV